MQDTVLLTFSWVSFPSLKDTASSTPSTTHNTTFCWSSVASPGLLRSRLANVELPWSSCGGKPLLSEVQPLFWKERHTGEKRLCFELKSKRAIG